MLPKASDFRDSGIIVSYFLLTNLSAPNGSAGYAVGLGHYTHYIPYMVGLIWLMMSF
jgi:hypothetical protein